MSYARKRLIKEVCSLPTAPFREGYVRDYIKFFCRQRSLNFTEDRFGNLVVCYGSNDYGPLLGFSAHMDHPGFIIEKDSNNGRSTALFYGGVDNEFFPSSRARFFTREKQVLATITKVQRVRLNRCRRVWLKVEGDVKAGDMGMWDLEAVSEKNSRLYCRACDDLVGCSTLLCILDEFHKKSLAKPFIAIFTSAEEAGLHGAKQLCRSRLLPDESIIISVETSSQLPGIIPGDGVVVRVGDKKGIFDNLIMTFIQDTATQLKKNKAAFSFRRKLMDGGRCEASVYQRHGYRTGAVCVPLANYHNRNRDLMQIHQEYVQLNDVNNMIELCTAMINNSDSIDTESHTPDYQSSEGKFGEFFLWD